MPEGDTLFRTASVLRDSLAGRLVTDFECALSRPNVEARRAGILGSRVEDVRSVGKHLLIRFEGRGTLRTHLGMRGSWHLYRPDSRWRLPAWKARVVVRTDACVAVCFEASEAEWIGTEQEGAHPGLTRLGPDLLSDDADLDEAVRRLRAQGDVEIGVALLNQGVMAGIGNVYKSEVLFVCGLSPFTAVSAIDETLARRIVATARQLMRANARGGARRTTPVGSHLWVYRRVGRPCRRCGASIASKAQGTPPRRTYWCPGCQ